MAWPAGEKARSFARALPAIFTVGGKIKCEDCSACTET